jgi:hypothetical protein
MKYLGALTDSTPLKVTLVLRRRAASSAGTAARIPTIFRACAILRISTVCARWRWTPTVARCGCGHATAAGQVLVDGQAQVIGGTSAVAPLWAALIARCNQKLGAALGDPHAALYQIGTRGFRDITLGNNGTYKTGVGWDACTGLGSPNGAELLSALAALQP